MKDPYQSWSFDGSGTVERTLLGLTLREDHAILVRCIDSDRSLDGVESYLRQHDDAVLKVSAGVLVPARAKAVVVTLLNGFDEVWIGSDKTDWSAIDDALPMTSDGTRFAGPEAFMAPSESIEDYLEPLIRSGATLGMGDGIGLNVVYRERP